MVNLVNNWASFLSSPYVIVLPSSNLCLQLVCKQGTCSLYHSVWAFERHHHSGQIPCTLSGAFEARVRGGSMATVVFFSKLIIKKYISVEYKTPTQSKSSVHKATLMPQKFPKVKKQLTKGFTVCTIHEVRTCQSSLDYLH